MRTAMGCITAPFATPSQAIELRPTPCDLASRTLRVDPANPSSSCLSPDEVVVSVVFKPHNGPVSAVVRATTCSPELEARVATWRNQLAPAGGSALCSPDPDLAVTTFDLGDGASECRLSARFPDSTAIAQPRTGLPLPFAGPASVAVTRLADPLPIALDARRCADAIGSTPLVTCADELFETDGSCRTEAANRSALVADFTALPPFNDFALLCSSLGDPTSPCDDVRSPDLFFALDSEGDALIPFDWSGVRGAPAGDLPPATVVSLQTRVPGFPGSGSPFAVSDPSQVRSLTPAGQPVPAVFNAALDPTNPDAAVFTGTTDGDFSVLLIQRSIEGGAPDFDLRYLLTANGGPGRIAGAETSPAAPQYQASTEGRVPLRGLCQSEDLVCFTREEALDGVRYNADDDTDDPAVVTLRDRHSGLRKRIGGLEADGSQAEGRAAPLLFRPPFRSVALDAEGKCAAFLEAEPWEGALDRNANGAVADTNLQVFCLDAAGDAQEVSGPAVLRDLGLLLLSADAEPVFFEAPNGPAGTRERGDPLVVAAGKVYFRASEAANSARETARIDLAADGTAPGGSGFAPDFSAEGSTVVFHSDASTLVAGDKNKLRDVFVRDRRTGMTWLGSVRFADPPPKRPLCEGRLIQARGASQNPAITPDGMHLCYESLASNLVDGDRNGVQDVLVYDRDTCLTERVSLSSAGLEGSGASRSCSIAATGGVVAFDSLARLAAADSDALSDVYVRDRATRETRLVSVDSNGVPLPGAASQPALSADGSTLAFEVTVGPTSAVFLHDRATGETLSLGLGSRPDVSDDGARVAFEVPGSSATQIALADVVRGFTEIVSLGSGLEPGASASTDPVISGDGRIVAFTSASALVPADQNGAPEVYLVDTRTRLVQRVDPAGASSGAATLTADGSRVAYDAAAGSRGVFARGPAVSARADFSGDGALDDQVLFVLDTTTPGAALHVIGPAGQVAVAGELFAYTRQDDARVLLRRCPSCLPEDLGRSASRVALSEDLICAEVLPGNVLACRRLDASGSLLEIRDASGSLIPIDAVAVQGSRVAFRTPLPGQPFGRLGILEVGAAGVTAILAGEPAREFVLGSTGLVAWNQCEEDVGLDLNGDGFEPEDCVLKYSPAGASAAVKSGEIVTDCFTDFCNPKFPFRVLGDVIRFLTRECRDGGNCGDLSVANARCDKDGDGDCDGVVVQNLDTRTAFQLVLTTVDLETEKSDPLGEPGIGPLGGLIFPGRVFLDRDSDAVLDLADNCAEVPNPFQVDFDQDGVGDDCDGFSCGDGDRDPSEFCEPALDGPDCAANCTPRVVASITENAINPDLQGVVPGTLFASSLLNLELSAVGDLPPQMIDPTALRLSAVEGGRCLPGGGPETHDLTDPQRYQSHLVDKNGDGRRDLTLHFSLSGSGLRVGTQEVCIKGAFRFPVGEFPVTTFEARAPVNVK